ncbi:hypothetical protein MMC25_005952 [Agyrium rufum]|nr:hypothetical protein [Agyrium rufum]
MDDSQTANNVYAVTIESDGTLSDGNHYATGGTGSYKVNPGAMGMMGMAAELRDPLSSSYAVLQRESFLWVCNAGDNTVSMFNIDENNATDLTLVKGPVESHGNFPTSLAYAESIKTLCVSNTGTTSGIQCYSVDATNGLTAIGDFLAYNLNQSTPPLNPLVASNFTNQTRPLITSINFNADETALVATLTGGGGTFPGYVVVYPIQNGQISSSFVQTHIPGTLTHFVSFSLLNSQDTYILDGLNGSVIASIDPNTYETTIKAETPVIGGAATCWAVQSPYTNSIYVTDAGVNRVTEVDASTGALIANHNVSNPNPGFKNFNPGNLDIGAYGTMVYALSPGLNSQNTSLSIVVLDVSGGAGTANYVQNFVPRGLGVAAMGQGMQIFSTSS